MRKEYECSWCKKKLEYHPDCFDYRIYKGPYRSYQTVIHYYFCNDCFNKIVKSIVDNKLKGVPAKRA